MSKITHQRWIQFPGIKGSNQCYRRIEFFENQMYWSSNINLQFCFVAPCSHGFYIAVCNKSSSSSSATTDYLLQPSSIHQHVTIYKNNGKKFSQIEWKKDKGTIIFLGWTQSMRLIIVTDIGKVYIYNVLGKIVLQGSSIDLCETRIEKKEHIILVKLYDINGIVMVTQTGRIFFCDDLLSHPASSNSTKRVDVFGEKVIESPYREFSFEKFDSLKFVGGVQVLCVEVIPKHSSLSNCTEFIICIDDLAIVDVGNVFVLECSNSTNPLDTTYLEANVGITCTDLKICDMGPFTNIAVAPDYLTIALVGGVIDRSTKKEKEDEEEEYYHEEDQELYLYVLPIDFSKTYLRFTLQSNGVNPSQLVYCGNELLVLNFGTQVVQEEESSCLLLINSSAEYRTIGYEGTIHLFSDDSCVRILTNFQCELLERVNPYAVNIFRMGSLEAGALLFDSYVDYLQKKPSAQKTIRELKQKQLLELAITTCVEAACREFDIATQQQLLKAASFGKLFLNEVMKKDTNEFNKQCRVIRTLNECRTQEFGLVITCDQLLHLSEATLVCRLAECNFHYLAYRIANLLDSSPLPVLNDWACKKTASAEEDEEVLFDQIKNRLQDHSGVSYAEIALSAYKNNRKKLAKKLLQLENKYEDLIPLLVEMSEMTEAIVKSIKSHDVDLLYIVLEYMIKHYIPKEQMFETIAKVSQCQRLFVHYCKQMGNTYDDLLQEYFEYKKQYAASGMVKLKQFYQKKSFKNEKELEEQLTNTTQVFLKDSRNGQTDAVLTTEYVRLTKLQKKLDEIVKKPGTFLFKSLHDTITLCIVNDLQEKAEKLKQKFGVSERRFCFIMVEALASRSKWEELYEYSKGFKKSPCGWEPFVEACLKHEMKNEAFKYVEKVEDPRTKVDYCIMLQRFREAIETAFVIRDPTEAKRLLEYIKTKTKNSKTIETIDDCISKIK